MFQHATENKCHNRLENYKFHNAEHHHRGQAHKHVRKRRQDDRRRINRTHRVGALPQSHSGLCGTLVGPGKDTHGTPVPLRREAVGCPRFAPRDTTTTTTRPRLPRHALVTHSFNSKIHDVWGIMTRVFCGSLASMHGLMPACPSQVPASGVTSLHMLFFWLKSASTVLQAPLPALLTVLARMGALTSFSSRAVGICLTGIL